MTNFVETAVKSAMMKGVGLVASLNRGRLVADRPHPFLTGIHQPMTEELTLENLPVTGTIPAGCSGRYLRIGPNPAAPKAAGYSMFSGDGMVHGIALGDGRAKWYRNRWIRSIDVAKATGLPAAPGPRHKGFETVNTNVAEIGGRSFALIEGSSFPVELDHTLDGQTYSDFGGTLHGSFTAHPQRDPLTGEYHAITYEGDDSDTIHHVVLSRDGRVVREEPITVEHGPSIHDCAITRRYVVVMDLPVTFSMSTMISGRTFPYRWNPKHQARIGLMPRSGIDTDVIWVDIDPLYIYHAANAFDLPDGRVALDVVPYATMFAVHSDGPNEGECLGIERWMIDPANRSYERRVVDATPQDFPRIDERRLGQSYRYVWTVGLPRSNPAFLGETFLLKHDFETGAREKHDFGEGHLPGEFAFVAAHANALEGEGWLIGLVVDVPDQKTDLVILDAMDFAAAPVATVRIPHVLPGGFHGNWIEDAHKVG